MTPAEIVELWSDALLDALGVARAQRAREIRGDHSVKSFNPQGLHSFSAAWGRVEGLEQALPGLSVLRYCGKPEATPRGVEQLGVVEANRQAEELVASGEIEWAT